MFIDVQKHMRGNALVYGLIVLFIGLAVINMLAPISAGMSDITVNVVRNSVGTPSQAFNQVVGNASQMQVTGYSFGQIVVIGILGTFAIGGLIAMFGGGFGGRGA